jgi:hypothetical protein
MQNLPRLDRLPEPIVRGRFIGFSKPELFRVWKNRGANPEELLWQSRSSGFGPPGAFLQKMRIGFFVFWGLTLTYGASFSPET